MCLRNESKTKVGKNIRESDGIRKAPWWKLDKKNWAMCWIKPMGFAQFERRAAMKNDQNMYKVLK